MISGGGWLAINPIRITSISGCCSAFLTICRSRCSSRRFEPLASRHGALRLRFRRPDSSGWRQRYDSHADGFGVETLAVAGEAELQREVSRVQASLDLEHGTGSRARRSSRAPAARRGCLIAIHHLAVDGVSWRILCDDLVTACQQLRRGQAARLPARTAPYWAWAEASGPGAVFAAGHSGESPRPAARTRTRNTSPGARRRRDPRAARGGPARAPRADRRGDPRRLGAGAGRRPPALRNRSLTSSVTERDQASSVDVTGRSGWFTEIHAVTIAVDRAAGPGAALARAQALRSDPSLPGPADARHRAELPSARSISCSPRTRAGRWLTPA